MPDVVDVSSGVEFSPGLKDLKKVKSFLKAVSICEVNKNLRKIF
jgi:phosphoribosylanthranilate isomerase